MSIVYYYIRLITTLIKIDKKQHTIGGYEYILFMVYTLFDILISMLIFIY